MSTMTLKYTIQEHLPWMNHFVLVETVTTKAKGIGKIYEAEQVVGPWPMVLMNEVLWEFEERAKAMGKYYEQSISEFVLEVPVDDDYTEEK